MSTALTYRHNFPSLLGRAVVDEVFGSFLNDMPGAVRQSTSGYPVADIFRNEDGSTSMQFALAGFAKDEINVEVKPEKRCITISGEASPHLDEDSVRRIAKRSFTKTFVNYDNNLDLGSATAEYENGLLTVNVPTRPEAESLMIKID
ncbi:MAG TPA: Hsp20/alpha crystallin family protein [Dehalococcoidia bacterium]|jgi:HSP20 family molecular chaperone IbpA|nr:Hsp20/alpha crystallin family protein [Dehalococcoidia bacterium]